MINIIWGLFIVLGIIYSVITNNFDLISNEIINSGETSLNMIIKIFPVMALWLGLMKIAEKSGLLEKISKFLSPIICFLFKEIPKNDKSIGLITSNFVFNLFGLGNASTPIGLKTMKSLQELNLKKDTATHSMITFLVLNTTGLTIIPTTIISINLMYGNKKPSELIFPCFFSSLIALVSGIIIDRFFQKRDYAKNI